MRCVILLAAIAGCTACRASRPDMVLWAWERPEDLRSIDPSRVAVAVLERKILVEGARVEVHRRMQPVRTPPRTQFITVVRIETKQPHPAALGRIAHEIMGAVRPDIEALQIDYDATASERAFYSELIRQVRRRLPPGLQFAITALVSWCMYDDWIKTLPIDEAVPMLFRTGKAERAVREFRQPVCRDSIGISTHELPASLPRVRRIYVFSPVSWNENNVAIAVSSVRKLQ